MFYKHKKYSLFPIIFKQIHSGYFSFFEFYFYEKNKFEIIKELKDNIFYTEKQKKDIFELFCKTQRLYHFFKKFYHYKTFHKLNTFDNDKDLNFNKLDLNSKYTIPIIQGNTVFYFKYTDLIKTINYNLLYSYNFFVESKFPKNPFNQTNFTKTNLFNLYLFIRNNNFTIPHIFYLFFKSNFNLDDFVKKNTPLIRDKILNNFYNDKSINVKYSDIIIMLRDYTNKISNMFIHPEFSREIVVNSFEKFLVHHLYSIYSLNPILKDYHSKLLFNKIKHFFSTNKKFGRFILTKNNRPKKNYSILNLLSSRIPFYSNIDSILFFITIETSSTPTLSIFPNLDSDSDFDSNSDSDLELPSSSNSDNTGIVNNIESSNDNNNDNSQYDLLPSNHS